MDDASLTLDLGDMSICTRSDGSSISEPHYHHTDPSTPSQAEPEPKAIETETESESTTTNSTDLNAGSATAHDTPPSPAHPTTQAPTPARRHKWLCKFRLARRCRCPPPPPLLPVSEPSAMPVSQSSPIQVSEPSPMPVTQSDPMPVSEPSPIQVSQPDATPISEADLTVPAREPYYYRTRAAYVLRKFITTGSTMTCGISVWVIATHQSEAHYWWPLAFVMFWIMIGVGAMD